MGKSEKVIGNFMWRLLERFGAQGVTLIVSIVLARLLDPEIYGTIALVTVITGLLQVFVDSGLGTALIQKKDADDLDFSSVFFFNLGMCIVIYIGLFFAAPLIAAFYDIPELTALVRALGLILVISGVKNIQQAYVSRNMLFKKFFFSTLAGTIGAAVVGITMAYMGYGVWALVGQYLFNATIDTLVLWFTVKWRPKFAFSFQRLKKLLGFGSKLLGVSLISTLYNDIRQILIGKFYSTSELAFYNKAKQFPGLLDTNINTSIDSVLLPTMSKKQNDISAVKAITRRSIKTSTFIMAPLLVGLAMCGDAFIELLLTEKWLPSVPYMRIFCITYIFTPIFTANYNAYKALGRSDLYLKVSLVSKFFGLIVLLATLPFGVMVMAYGLLLSNFVSQLVCTYPNRKLLNYKYIDQLIDVLPHILLAAAMGGIIYLVELLTLKSWLTLLIQVPLGVLVYWAGSKLFKLESYHYVLNTAKSFIKGRRRKEMKEKKKLMILGGSRYALPVIEAAHRLGLHVITCDYLPDNIAHKYSDEYCNVSIIDKEAVLLAAKSLGISGIISFACDPGVTTAAYVAEQLGLPSCGPYESVCILQNKGKFRQFLCEHGFNVPKAKSYKDIDAALNDVEYFNWPVIVKPTDSAGSKGVKRVNSPDKLRESIEYAISFSHSDEFIIEDFLEKKGHSSDTDSFSVDGILKFVSFSAQRFDIECENPYTPSAYSWPSTISNEHQDELRSEIQRLLSLLNLKTSVYNIEVRECTNGKAYIMELSPRGGGNRLSECLRYATGVDLITNAVRAAMGMPVEGIEQKDYNGYWAEIILHSNKPGMFDKLWISDDIKENVVEEDIWVENGADIGGFSGANEAIGTLILKFDTNQRMQEVLDNQDGFVQVLLRQGGENGQI